MWRQCDLHNHTTPNEQCDKPWDPSRFVSSCLEASLDVVAVTDHDGIDHVGDAVGAARGTGLTIIPGVELSTDRGHLLVLAPDDDGLGVLANLIARVGARPGSQVSLNEVLHTATALRQPNDQPYATKLVLIGAHVDARGSLLSTTSSMELDAQHELARRLHALEVRDVDVIREWTAGGVKQGPRRTLIQGSDCHDPESRVDRRTWLYLPQVDAASLRHALALREASVVLEGPPPTPPAWFIESITFTGGGHHDDQTFHFCERTNALIGPPNAGKSFIVDALRFVFDLQPDIPEVQATSEARLSSCLPDGGLVEVRVRTPDGTVLLSRRRGARRPEVPFRPIIFGQTELTRRANAARPAIELLDIHCPDLDVLQADVTDVAVQLAEQFREVLQLAESARRLRESVDNPVDGLGATRRELAELAGTEQVANEAVAATRVERWRDDALTAIDSWRTDLNAYVLSIPAEPGPFPAPIDLAHFTPGATLSELAAQAHTRLAEKATELAGEMSKLIEDSGADFLQHKNSIEGQLAAAGFVEGSAVHQRLNGLRTRIHALEHELTEVQALEAQIDEGLVELKRLQVRAKDARDAVTAARRGTCTRVNPSMRSFFASITHGGDTTRLDELINDLKVGTRIRASTRNELRDQLDRPAVLELAVRLTQGIASVDDAASDQEQVVAEALKRGRSADLCRLSHLWPDDQLGLSMKPVAAGGSAVPFEQLTEGLRALAIKEISFAASELPVITDQPEDAVPTRAVFESLVPTLREQRTVRQFIVVSHDANIVVASDIDHVWALQANEDGTAHSGSLADDRIRLAALEHLEGGDAAFQLRAERYAYLGGGTTDGTGRATPR